MSTSKKLEIIYHNCQSDSIRWVRRNISTMTTYTISRLLLPEAKSISDISRSGFYFFISEKNKIKQIYVGQKQNGVIQSDDYNCSEDFWNKAIMFLSDNKAFTLDLISGLKKKIIRCF